MHGSHFAHRDLIGLPPASVAMPRLTQDRQLDQRAVAEECPVAMVYDGTTAAVLMASPGDLRDFAVGFSLTEGIINSAAEIEAMDIVPGCDGIELRMWLAASRGRAFKKRQRRLVGPTGCGLCGIESLSEAVRTFPPIERKILLRSRQIGLAVEALAAAQTLNQVTRATHAAGFYLPDDRLAAMAEDVGRHNALDKLVGMLAAKSVSAGSGAIVLTSRVSIEMVQKTAAAGCPILVAISAPTARAIRAAETCGITLVAIARGSSFEIFSHPEGISDLTFDR